MYVKMNGGINSQLKIIYAISFMDLFAIGLTFPLLAPYLRSIGASHSVIGLIGSAYYGVQIISGPIIGKWSDIAGRKRVLIFTLLASSILYALLGLSSSILTIFVIRFILGIVKHTQTLVKAIVVDLVPKEKLPQVFGKSAALSTLGFVFGPIIGGHLSEFKHGFTYVCFLTSFVFMSNIVLLSMTSLPNPIQPPKSQIQSQPSFLQSFRDLTKHINSRQFRIPFLIRFIFALSATTYLMNQSVILGERYQFNRIQTGYVISFVSSIGVGSAFLLGYVTKLLYSDDKLQRNDEIDNVSNRNSENEVKTKRNVETDRTVKNLNNYSKKDVAVVTSKSAASKENTESDIKTDSSVKNLNNSNSKKNNAIVTNNSSKLEKTDSKTVHFDQSESRIRHSFALFALSIVGLLLAPSSWIYILCLVPFGIANSTLRIVTMESILRLTGGEDRGCISGTTNSIMSVARFLAPLIAGTMGDLLGGNGIIASAGCFAVIGMILVMVVERRRIIKVKVS